MENIIWVVLLCAVLALLFAAWKTSAVSKADAGTERMKEIAGNISDGARAFLFAEYKILVIFVAVLYHSNNTARFFQVNLPNEQITLNKFYVLPNFFLESF